MGQAWINESIGPVQTKPFVLDEAAKKTGQYIMRGIFGEGDIRNGNGRIYPSALLESQVNALQERIKNNRVVCALDHPADGRALLENAAARLTKLWMEGPVIMGEAIILNTAKGQTLRALVEGGFIPGVSSRGTGSVKPTAEGDVVQEDYRLITFDFVEDPSVSTALPKLYVESQEHVLSHDDPIILFQEAFPDAFSALNEAAQKNAVERAQEQIAKNLEQAVEAERTRVREELTTIFEKRLCEALLDTREALQVEIREKLSRDPAVGGAKAVLAQIVEMVDAYRQVPDAQVVEDAVKALTMNLTTVQAEKEQVEERLQSKQRLLEMEARIAGHPLAPQLRKVLSPVVERGMVEDLDAAIGEFLIESKDMVPESKVEQLAQERVLLAEQKAQVQIEQEKNAQLSERVAMLEKKLQSAVAIGEQLNEAKEAVEQQFAEAQEEADTLRAQVEQLRLDVYKQEQVQGAPNARNLLEQMRDVHSKSVVDKMITGGRAQAMVDRGLEEARQQIRGAAPGATAFRKLEEATQSQYAAGVATAAVELPTQQEMRQLWGGPQ